MSRPMSRKRKSTNKKPKFTQPVPSVGKLPVSMRLAAHLRELDRLMFAEFGDSGSFAYVVQANGKLISASDAKHGIVVPNVHIELEERIWSPSELWQLPSSSKIIHQTLGMGEVQRAGRVDSTDWDDRVVVFEHGERFVLPAPVPTACVAPWDQTVKVVLPHGTEIDTAWARGV